MSRLYAIAVVKCGISPEYFLDKMTKFELVAILEYSNELEKDELERLRIQCFYTILPHTSDKNITPQKLMPFVWDKIAAAKATSMSKEEIDSRVNQLLN